MSIKGGYFIRRGLSLLNTDFNISVNISTLEKPHMPFIPKLSIAAPYLTSAHGGIIVADSDFELTSDDYAVAASGSGTGPWFNKKLHNFTHKADPHILLIHMGNFPIYLDEFLTYTHL